jgi:N-dimethylarginine dimethylaminohydrolase
MSSLPTLRQPEEPYADQALKNLGFETRQASVLFSGQGDALIIGGNRVLIGNGYRTNPKVADEIREWLGLEPIVVRAKPQRRWYGAPVLNKVTGLWDSYFYDLDIAVGVIRPDMIAVCWDGLTGGGKKAIRELKDVEIIPVDYHEAKDALACNLVSTGSEVIMVDNAPLLSAELEKRGLKVIKLPNHELRKGGGGFRCSSLSLYK